MWGTLASFGTFWTLSVGDLIASREFLGYRIPKHGSDDKEVHAFSSFGL
jgi:hypothetical protein